MSDSAISQGIALPGRMGYGAGLRDDARHLKPLSFWKLSGLLANFDTAGEFGAVRERQEPRGEVLVGRDEAASCGSSALCPCALKSVQLFPRRRCVSRIARASFPKGNRYMRLRDEWGAV